VSTVTLTQPPLFLQEGEYSARLARNITAFIGSEGVIATNDLKVQERAAAPAMQVEILAGRAVVDGDDIPNQRAYFAVSEETVELPVPASDPTNPRIDLVVLRVLDSDAGVVGDEAQIQLIEGTPNVAPTVPAVPDTAIALAEIAVGANVIVILEANITDRRVSSAPLVQPDLDDLADVDVSGAVQGDYLVYDGSEWVTGSPIGLIIALGG
jgi:hypothetical protein